MDDVILNSLLRYSKQLTPSRETYPLPSKEWTGALRGVQPQVNLSTYYLLDNPSLASTPFKSQSKMHSSVSTSAISPEKRRILQQFSPVKRNSDSKADQIKKIMETEVRNKKTSSDKQRVDVQKKKGGTVKRESEDSRARKAEESIRKEFEEFKKQQAEVVSRMQDEIIMLRQKIYESNIPSQNLHPKQ